MLKPVKRMRSRSQNPWKAAALEQRLLLAADVAAPAPCATAGHNDSVAGNIEVATEATHCDEVELVVINADVAASETLLPAHARHADIIILDATKPGIEQVTQILSAYRNVSAIHFVTHGRPRAIKLGSEWVDAAGFRTINHSYSCGRHR